MARRRLARKPKWRMRTKLSGSMQQEATEEFIECERHPPLFVLVGGVPPAKGDFLVGEGEQAVVGEGYTMSVAAQITKHILGASEG